MAVTQVGTPAATVYTTTNGANTPSLAWSGTQPRTAGDILVLVVTAAATTSVTAPSAPSGWTAGPAVGNARHPARLRRDLLESRDRVDAVPAITVTTSGTTRCGFTLFELTGAETVLSPIDTTGTFASGFDRRELYRHHGHRQHERRLLRRVRYRRVRFRVHHRQQHQRVHRRYRLD